MLYVEDGDHARQEHNACRIPTANGPMEQVGFLTVFKRMEIYNICNMQYETKVIKFLKYFNSVN